MKKRIRTLFLTLALISAVVFGFGAAAVKSLAAGTIVKNYENFANKKYNETLIYYSSQGSVANLVAEGTLGSKPIAKSTVMNKTAGYSTASVSVKIITKYNNSVVGSKSETNRTIGNLETLEVEVTRHPNDTMLYYRHEGVVDSYPMEINVYQGTK